MIGIGIHTSIGSGGAPAALPWVDGVTRTALYINTLGSGSYVDPQTGQTVSWDAGDNGNTGLAANGASTAGPWLNMANLASLSAGNYVAFVNSSTDASAPLVHTAARFIMPAGVDLVLVPVSNGARIRPTNNTAAQSRLFDLTNNSSFIRLRRGLGNAAFAVDCANLSTTGAYGVFCVGSPDSNVTMTGTYGVEIDGAHTWIDSASGTTERLIVACGTVSSLGTVRAAPTGTPTFIFKNGFKLVGAAGTNIRGVNIYHLGAGTVTVNGMDFAGSANHQTGGSGFQYRSLDYKGLFNIETASAGADVAVSNTYGEFTTTSTTGQCAGLRVMDCDVVASGLAHKLTSVQNINIRPTWFSGYNQTNSAVVSNYTAEITAGADVPQGHLLLIGEDGKVQPLLFLSDNTTGVGRTVTAEWDFFVPGDVGKVIEPLGSSPVAGQFTITAFTDARRVTVTVDEAFHASLGQYLRSYKEVGDTTNGGAGGAWRVSSKLTYGTITGGSTRGPDDTDSTIHGLMIGGCSGVTASGITVQYARYGGIHKDATGCITSVATANIFANGNHLTAKGGSGCEFTGCETTLSDAVGYTARNIIVQVNDYGIAATSHEFNNNVFNVASSSSTNPLVIIDNVSDATFVGNEWHVVGGGGVPAEFDYPTSLTNRTFAEWQAAYGDTDFAS